MNFNCVICLDEFLNILEHNECNVCTSIICNYCYNKYIYKYQYTSCPQCRSKIIEKSNNNKKFNTVISNNQNGLTSIQKYISYCVLVVFLLSCYILGKYLTGLNSTNIKYILYNIFFGLLVIYFIIHIYLIFFFHILK